MKRIIVSACLGLLAIGCADLQLGQPIRDANIQAIRPGFTTKDEVRKYFGSPMHNVAGPEGEIWVYRYASGTSNSAPKELTISFNGNLVSTYSSH